MPEQRQSLPEQIDVDPTAMPPHTPRETSLLKAMTGKTVAELAQDGGDSERMLVWFTLRRLGFDPSWEEAGDVLINYVTPDPPTAGGSTSSPPSATTGG